MLHRAHTAAAVALIALVPLVPIGMRVYAAVASVEKSDALARAEAIIRTAPPPAGARRLETQAYGLRAWEGGDTLTPIGSWNVETAYRLPRPPRPMRIAAIVRLYREGGWHVARGSDPGFVKLVRPRSTIQLDFAEYARPHRHAVSEYGLSVSQ